MSYGQVLQQVQQAAFVAMHDIQRSHEGSGWPGLLLALMVVGIGIAFATYVVARKRLPL